MIKVSLRGAANAQGLFDALRGHSVTWREPFRPQDAHTIIAGTYTGTADDMRELLEALRIDRAKVTEF